MLYLAAPGYRCGSFRQQHLVEQKLRPEACLLRHVATCNLSDHRFAQSGKKFRYIVVVRADASFQLNGTGEKLDKLFIPLLDQFTPRFRDRRTSLGKAMSAAVFFASRLESFP